MTATGTDPPATMALAFDYGTRRIGVAVSNSISRTARELGTVAARDGAPEWQAIDAMVADWAPDVLVVGLPYNADGSESEMTASARTFAAALGARYERRVEAVDERFTSAEAEAELREQRRAGIRARRVRKTDIDSTAARLIAESWLREGGQLLVPG